MASSSLRLFALAAMTVCFGFPVSRAEETALPNGGFEQHQGGQLSAWEAYGKGYTLDASDVLSGRSALRCTADGGDGMGVRRVLRYDTPDRRPIIIGGWSRALEVAGGGDYCVYLDIFFDDGTPWWGQQVCWRRGTHDWEYNGALFSPPKPVKEIQVFVFLRRTSGTAWFDDIFLARDGLHLVDLQIGTDWPRKDHTLLIKGRLTQAAPWNLAVLTADDQVTSDVSGHGTSIATLLTLAQKESPSRLRLTAESDNGRLQCLLPFTLPPRPANPVTTGCVVWPSPGSRKVYPTEPPPVEKRGTTRVSLARGERESFQVSVRTADTFSLTGVTLRAAPLSLPGGERLSPEALSFHVVGYVKVAQCSGHPAAPAEPNWCPEVLLPPHPVDVGPGRTQSLWVDVHAEVDTPPGIYSGNLLLTTPETILASLPLEIEVFPFALPKTPSLRTAFAIMDNFTKQAYGDFSPELRRQSLDIMLEHRLNPDDISRYRPPRIEDLLYAREHGMNAFNLLNLVPEPDGEPLWVCFVDLAAYGDDFNRKLAARLDPLVAELRRHDLAKLAYVYGFDERGPEYDATIRRICHFVKKRYPEISTFTTAAYMVEASAKSAPDDEDGMDWYCPLTSRYDLETSRRLRARGKQVWWYVCCGPQYPYANFASMDYPSIEGRLLGWMTYGFESDGLLYWHVNYWSGNALIQGPDPYLDWSPTCIYRMTGDGALIYPHKEGLLSSIRLKNVRDAVEDYEYLALLEAAAGREAAMTVCRKLVTSMTEYSRDPSRLEQVRLEVAHRLAHGPE